jgi:hypothetical protein
LASGETQATFAVPLDFNGEVDGDLVDLDFSSVAYSQTRPRHDVENNQHQAAFDYALEAQ